jgi:branched-chain amino acid transport system substrate-binding protein
VVLSALSILACGSRAPREIRIGILAVLEGEYASSSGEPSLEGARMAVREANQAGGILVGGERHIVVLVERSHETRPDAAASAARASINLDRADVLIGPQLSTHAVAAGAVAEDARVPMISPMSSSPGTTAGRDFVFRMAFLDAFQGALLAEYARADLGARRAAMLYDVAHPYSTEIARLFAETFERKGGTVVASETFTTDQRSGYDAQLRRIAASGADVLLLPNYAATASVQAREGRALGVTAALLGSDSWDLTSMSATPAADGSVVVHQWHPDLKTIESVAFVSAYRELYGKNPRATAALTYDAVRLALDAIRRAGSLDGPQIAAMLRATGTFGGASGTIRFNGKNDPHRSGVLSTIQGGRHALLRVVEATP